jgi:hypothetical protein
MEMRQRLSNWLSVVTFHFRAFRIASSFRIFPATLM